MVVVCHFVLPLLVRVPVYPGYRLHGCSDTIRPANVRLVLGHSSDLRADPRRAADRGGSYVYAQSDRPSVARYRDALPSRHCCISIP